jgi:lauroyl/myristoyl acyltransferase
LSQALARLGVAAMSRALPPDAAYRAAARLAWLVLGEKTRRLRSDTSSLFPDRPADWVDDAVRRQRYHRAWSALDKVMLPRLSEEEILARCDAAAMARTYEVLDRAQAEGKGCIVYTMHFGRPALSPFVLASRYHYVAFRARTGIEAFDRPLVARLEELGVETIDAGDIAGGVQAIRALKRNKFLFVLVDGRKSQRLTRVPFVGRELAVGLGFAELAERTGAALVAGVTFSTAPLGFRIQPTRVDYPTGGASPQERAAALMRPLEEAVMQDVGQWYGINRLFRQSDNERLRR